MSISNTDGRGISGIQRGDARGYGVKNMEIVKNIRLKTYIKQVKKASYPDVLHASVREREAEDHEFASER